MANASKSTSQSWSRNLKHIVTNIFPKNIRLQFIVPDKVWTILGDATQVHQVLLNFCVNARDAMPDGGDLTFSAGNCVIDDHYLRVNSDAREGTYVRLAVNRFWNGDTSGDYRQDFRAIFYD